MMDWVVATSATVVTVGVVGVAGVAAHAYHTKTAKAEAKDIEAPDEKTVDSELQSATDVALFQENQKAWQTVARELSEEEEEDEVCCICIEEGNKKGENLLHPLGCPSNHAFHGKCMERWLMSSGQAMCPMCRSPFVKEVEL